MSHRNGIDIKDANGRDYAHLLQGQAGVWAVASRLALAGHVPMFPGVDYGYDLMLQSGLRIQIKSGWLRMSNTGYPCGYYVFDIRKRKERYRKGGQLMQWTVNQDVQNLYDFVICWGINENRFWVIPSQEVKTAFHFTSREGKFIGTKNNTEKRLVKKTSRLAQYEDRWDLLDIQEQSKELIESVEVSALNQGVE